MKRSTRNGLLVGAFVLLQIYLIVTGGGIFKPFITKIMHKQGKPTTTTTAKVQNKRVKGQGKVEMLNFNPQKANGSYVRYIPPLRVNERPYYTIAILVHVKDNGRKVYQQFLVIPTKKVPKNIQTEMKKSLLQTASKEFNVRGSVKKTLKYNKKNGRYITFDNMNFNSIYNKKNEYTHYQTTQPFFIPPYPKNKKIDAQLTFTKSGMNSEGHDFDRINTAKAVKLMKQATNTKRSWAGY